MKKKLLIIAVLIGFVIAAGDAFAFGRRGGGQGPGMGGGLRQLNFMQTELGLSDKQVKQIFDIGTQYREKRFENRNNQDKLAELRDEHRKAVESVLTKEQLEKFNNLRNDNRRCGWRN